MLSTATSEYRTLVGARREMMGWTQFQLEPSALRAPDPYGTPGRLSPDGGHLPATLEAMARRATAKDPADDVGQRVANRVAELFEDVRSLRVDRDDKREQYSLVLTELDGTEHPASSLSDGTLRFLALAVLEAGAVGPSLLCLEEPENGIHPDRIPAMLDLLQDLAVDPTKPVEDGNPLRQVIVNTHSPAVLREVPDDAIVVAQSERVTTGGRQERRLGLFAIPGTWRTGAGAAAVPLRHVFPYVAPPPATDRTDRLLGRPDVQLLHARRTVRSAVPAPGPGPPGSSSTRPRSAQPRVARAGPRRSACRRSNAWRRSQTRRASCGARSWPLVGPAGPGRGSGRTQRSTVSPTSSTTGAATGGWRRSGGWKRTRAPRSSPSLVEATPRTDVQGPAAALRERLAPRH